MKNLGLIMFAVFLLTLMILDIAMIFSLLKPGDERKQLIVWKASAFTLLVVVGTLILDIVKTIIKIEPAQINPFIKLSTTAIVYCVSLLFFRKRHGN